MQTNNENEILIGGLNKAGGDQELCISPDQVEALIGWLTEARDELSGSGPLKVKKGWPPGTGGAESLGGYQPGVK